MIIVSGSITVDVAHREQAVAVFRDVAEASRQEPGCNAYAISADLDTPGKFRVFEEWESREPLLAHMSTPHIARFMSAIADIHIVEMQVVQYEATRWKRVV